MRTKGMKLVTAAAVASMAIAGTAQAKNGADDPANAKGPRDDGVVHLRQGADDPANHDRGDAPAPRCGRRERRRRRAAAPLIDAPESRVP